MSFGAPWLLALAPLLLAVGWLAWRRRDAGRPRRWPALTRVEVAGDRVREPSGARRRPPWLLAAALLLAATAAAGPRWGEDEAAAYRHTREVLVAMDLSRSMATEDVEPSRLGRAKDLATALLDELGGESVGLVVFAGTAFVQVPLGPDYQIVRQFLPTLDVDYLPAGGSDYGRLLEAALDGFGDSPAMDRYLFVLGDGESSTGDWETRLPALAKRDVRVIGIGVGTAEGALVPDGLGGWHASAAGEAVRSRLMPATLQALARRTGGRYVEASALDAPGAVRALVADTVESGRRGPSRVDSTVQAAERFQWLLLPALLLALGALVLEFPRPPRPRALRRREPPAPVRDAPGAAALACAVAGTLVLVAAGPVAAHFDDEAHFDVRPSSGPGSAERLRAIVEHLAEFGYDAFDLRLMVEETLRYGHDAHHGGEPVPEGVVRDAIEATLRGEALDAALVDWNYYRHQLRQLLAELRPPGESERSQAPRTVMDEENATPQVEGNTSRQFASDSFGQGAASRTDATLGELTPAADPVVERPRGAAPPRAPRSALVRGASGAADVSVDPILAHAQRGQEEAARADSPARLHQLLTEGTTQRSPTAIDW